MSSKQHNGEPRSSRNLLTGAILTQEHAHDAIRPATLTGATRRQRAIENFVVQRDSSSPNSGLITQSRSETQSGSAKQLSTYEPNSYMNFDGETHFLRQPGVSVSRSWFPPRTSSLPSARANHRQKPVSDAANLPSSPLPPRTSSLPSARANTVQKSNLPVAFLSHDAGRAVAASPNTKYDVIIENKTSHPMPGRATDLFIPQDGLSESLTTFSPPAIHLVPGSSVSMCHPTVKIKRKSLPPGAGAGLKIAINPAAVENISKAKRESLRKDSEMKLSMDYPATEIKREFLLSSPNFEINIPDALGAVDTGRPVTKIKKKPLRINTDFGTHNNSEVVRIDNTAESSRSVHGPVAEAGAGGDIAEASTLAVENNRIGSHPPRTKSYAQVARMAEFTFEGTRLDEKHFREEPNFPAPPTKSRPVHDVVLQNGQPNAWSLFGPVSTSAVWPPFVEVRRWVPAGSTNGGGVQSRESATWPSPNDALLADKKLIAIYVNRQSTENLLHVYRDWPVDESLPSQFENLWGSKIIGGMRVEQPPFERPSDPPLLDLYHWVLPNGKDIYQWVDHRTIARYLVEPGRYPNVQDRQALQFSQIKTLIFNHSSLDELVSLRRNAKFLTQFPKLTKLVINIQGKHFGPSRAYKEMMGFTEFTGNSEHALQIQERVSKLLRDVRKDYPRWLPPQVILAVRAVTEAQSRTLAAAMENLLPDMVGLTENRNRFSCPNLQLSLGASSRVVSEGFPRSRNSAVALNVSFDSGHGSSQSHGDEHSLVKPQLHRSATEQMLSSGKMGPEKSVRFSTQISSSSKPKSRIKGFIRAVSDPKTVIRKKFGNRSSSGNVYSTDLSTIISAERAASIRQDHIMSGGLGDISPSTNSSFQSEYPGFRPISGQHNESRLSKRISGALRLNTQLPRSTSFMTLNESSPTTPQNSQQKDKHISSSLGLSSQVPRSNSFVNPNERSPVTPQSSKQKNGRLLGDRRLSSALKSMFLPSYSAARQEVRDKNGEEDRISVD